MVSRTLPAVGIRLVVAFAAVIGAQAAWMAGYWASFAICVLIAAWSAAMLLGGVRAGEHRESAKDRRWSTALLAREREAKSLAAFLDHAPVPILTLSPPDTLSALNLAARRFFSTDDVVAEPPEALLSAVRAAAPGERRTLTLEVEGAARSYALTVAELVVDGAYVRIVALVDIQAEVQAAEAAALRELIQVLSHEIMNSLTPVTSLAQTTAELLRAPDPGAIDQAREAAEGVARRSQGLLRFIEAYRELARLPEPRFADVSVRRLLEDVALLFRSRWEARGVGLELDLPPPEFAASLDADLMSQALLNVLANAAEAALEAGGEAMVRLSAEPGRGGRPVIRVCDTGPGVNQPDPNVIFRPFFTTKPTGTGVGLSLARQIVLGHGGEIAVAPSDGPGATIVISL